MDFGIYGVSVLRHASFGNVETSEISAKFLIVVDILCFCTAVLGKEWHIIFPVAKEKVMFNDLPLLCLDLEHALISYNFLILHGLSHLPQTTCSYVRIKLNYNNYIILSVIFQHFLKPSFFFLFQGCIVWGNSVYTCRIQLHFRKHYVRERYYNFPKRDCRLHDYEMCNSSSNPFIDWLLELLVMIKHGKKCDLHMVCNSETVMNNRFKRQIIILSFMLIHICYALQC